MLARAEPLQRAIVTQPTQMQRSASLQLTLVIKIHQPTNLCLAVGEVIAKRNVSCLILICKADASGFSAIISPVQSYQVPGVAAAASWGVLCGDFLPSACAEQLCVQSHHQQERLLFAKAAPETLSTEKHQEKRDAGVCAHLCLFW